MILVTGGAGFIGSQLLRQLNNKGIQTVTIDNLSTGVIENIPLETHFIEGDLGSKKTMDKLEGLDIKTIFHIAGQSSGEVSFENPTYDLDSNVRSTVLLLDFALKTKIKTFIYASSMAVYGAPEELPVSETSSLSPKSFYAVGKLASEQYLKIYSNLGINCCALRFFNVYGPGQNLRNLKQGMFSIFLAQALSGNTIIVKGALERFRDFVYIDDVIDSLIQSLIYLEDNSYGVFNICTNTKTTVKEIIESIKVHLTKELDIVESEGTPGDQFGIYGSYNKAFSKLGWSPKITFSDGVKRMIKWATNDS